MFRRKHCYRRGAAVTPRLTEESNRMDKLLEVVRNARVYDLEQLRFAGMPALKMLQPVYYYSLHRQHRTSFDPKNEGPRTGASGMLFMSDQSGTHVDALCHQAYDQSLFGGVLVDHSVETPWGYKRLGADTIPPILQRGVLIDVPASKGMEHLPDGYAITEEDLRTACEFEKVVIKEKDVVLVRTGFGKFWNDPEKFGRYAAVSSSATRWIADRRMSMVGVDNPSWDVFGERDPVTKANLLGHVELIVKRGIGIIENMYLEELSKDACFEFLFVGLPLKLKGATGSPMRPIALCPA